MPSKFLLSNVLLPVIGIGILLTSCNTSPPENHHPPEVSRQIAEFEQLEALWLIWPKTDHKEGEDVVQVTLSIIQELVSDLRVVVCCADENILSQARSTLSNHHPGLQNIEFRVIPSMEIWTRDMGPVFVETADGQQAIADFNFDSWGYADTLDASAKIEEVFDEKVAELFNLPLISSSMISEGGSREVNGKGTLMVAAAVEEARNPGMTRAEMEAEYRRLLGIKKVIWLDQGLVEDSHTFLGPLSVDDNTKAYTLVTTNGHVDEFARFVNDSTILLAAVDSADWNDPLAAENHRRLEENFSILSESTDQDGQAFRILRMPLPHTILSSLSPGDYVYEYIKTLDYLDGSEFPEGESVPVVVPASYLNFIITNKVVLGQKYWREGMHEEVKLRDEEAQQILEDVFPGRRVVMLDALAVNLGGGGLHCISMHQPAALSGH